MKINYLDLANFRRFEQTRIEFSEQFTVLIGDNGSGKTAILDAIALTLNAFLSEFGSAGQRDLKKTDVRRVRIEFEDQTTSEAQYPAHVFSEITFSGENFTIGQEMISRGKGLIHRTGKNFDHYLSKLIDNVESGDEGLLPIISYYGTDRLWREGGQEGNILEPRSRLDVYNLSLESTSTADSLYSWFRTHELINLQKGDSKILDAVKQAISKCVPEWGTVYFDVKENELMARKPNGPSLALRHMSDGVRNMIALVSDIARKTTGLNPQLGSQSISETPGVVLIDELGLHLHPNWQRRVVNDLRAVFPSIQFITTTHSPFIIQAVRGNELLNLNRDTSSHEDWHSIEDIAEQVMGVDNVQRSQRFINMQESAEEFFELLEKTQDLSPDEIKKVEERLDNLIEPYSDDPAFSAYLKIKRQAKMKGKGS